MDKNDWSSNCPFHDDELAKQRSLSLPEHFTFVQRNYVYELCQLVYSDHLRLRGNIYKFERERALGEMDDEELNAWKWLLDLDLQSLKWRERLLEQAITTPLFDEEGFWKAWSEDPKRHTAIKAGLLLKVWRKSIERARRLLESKELQELEKPVK